MPIHQKYREKESTSKELPYALKKQYNEQLTIFVI